MESGEVRTHGVNIWGGHSGGMGFLSGGYFSQKWGAALVERCFFGFSVNHC